MKKVMLCLLLAVCCVGATYANSLQVLNFTPCDYTISSQGGYINVTGYPTAGSSQFFSSGSFSSAKVARDGNWTYQINVGGTPIVTNVPSTTVGDLPPCNMNMAYTVSWSVNSAGNVVLLIL